MYLSTLYIITYFYEFVKNYFLLLVVFLLLPEAVTAYLIAFGPVFLRFAAVFSDLVIFAATAFGLQAG